MAKHEEEHMQENTSGAPMGDFTRGAAVTSGLDASEGLCGSGRYAPDAVAGKETVLLVEDEAPLRTLLGKVLRRDGYEVLEACGGREALCLQARHAGSIHVTVTDVQMHEMSGPELAERLRTLQPGMRVLFVSGSFPKSISFARIRSQPRTAFLQKPFFANSLLRVVENLLERSEGEGEP